MNEVTINVPNGYVSLIPNEYDKTNFTECFDINALFWEEIFSDSNIKRTIEFAKVRYKHSKHIPLKIQVILNNTNQFYTNLKRALKYKFTYNTSKQDFFNCLETLEMFCELYSYCWTTPYKLTIAEGFVHNKDSAEFLDEHCLIKNCNPYLEFIQFSVMPKLVNNNPDILWIIGRPDIAIFSLIKLIKIEIPQIYIILCDPKTEYYSLYKIRDLLVRNTVLFNLFDCILFSNSIENRKKLVDAINDKREPIDVYGCIYKIQEKIVYKKAIPYALEESNNLSGINLKLFKNHCCYWNKCSFCGINQKYDGLKNYSQWNILHAVNILKKRSKSGNPYMWLIDEAIPPATLKQLMFEFRKNTFDFVWHFRTRIDPALLDVELINLLKENGVKSIILGFESASKRILHLMNKTFNDDYLIIAEKIVEKYTSQGIHIHFPVLIGFPTETDAERESSFKFVEYLSAKYPLFSYNINILELDISSELFKNWENYDIKQLKFPCLPKYFLGNSVEWECDTKTLNLLRTVQMKRQFTWYPDKSCLSIHTFYNLWEQKRGLLCKELINDEAVSAFDENCDYVLDSNIILFTLTTDEFCIYHYYTHNFICGGEIINYIYNAFLNLLSTKEIISSFNYFGEAILVKFLSDLLKLKFIILR